MHRGSTEQHFTSRLSDLYPAADDPFFTQPQQQAQSDRASPKRSLKSNKHDDGMEEHKYPEQPRRQPSDLVEHRSHQPTTESSLMPFHAHDPFDVFGEMDRTFDAQMQRMGRIMEQFTGSGLGLFGAGGLGDHSRLAAEFPKDGSSSYSYHSSSSSYSAGPDGSSKPFYRHVSQSSSCVDGVSASRARYEDSLGNRREQQGWGLGQQHREVLTDRNALGEERSRENLKELQPEHVADFTKQWEQRRAEVDSKHKTIGGGSNQQSLKNEPIRSIKSASANESNAGRRQLHA